MTAGDALARPERNVISLLEGMDIHQGPPGSLRLDNELLSKHVLFLGGIGSGKTNAMKHLIRQLRMNAAADDVFVIFDTKGDFLRSFYRPGDAVISSHPGEDPGGVVWNLFRDLPGDAGLREEEIYEIASTVFSDELEQAGENTFFAAAARDIFAAVVQVMAGQDRPQDRPYSNEQLRETLEFSAGDLQELLESDKRLAGTARYLQGGDSVESILAFLQLTLRKSFSGVFRQRGDFSVREFIRQRGGRALFIEYDIATGASLLPVYRLLMDMAIKEALGLGRRRLRTVRPVPDNFYFVMDEFALLPQLSHISDGINFGRELGLKFLVATQNVNQVLHGYSPEIAESILAGFGTLFAFRLMDDASRSIVRQRFGANRKQVTTYAAVRHEGVRQAIVDGNVIEDWHMSGLERFKCIASLPEGPPFFFGFQPFPGVSAAAGPAGAGPPSLRLRGLRDLMDDQHLDRLVTPFRDVLRHVVRADARHRQGQRQQQPGHLAEDRTGFLAPLRAGALALEVTRERAHVGAQTADPAGRVLEQFLPAEPAEPAGRLPGGRDDAVNVAGRIADLAHHGQVLLPLRDRG